VTPVALAEALAENADEPHAELLARELVARRQRAPITRTRALADAIRVILASRPVRRRTGEDDDCIRRVFQAIRIAVNDEFGVLDLFLKNLPFCLRPGGRVAMLTFHSGEDRRVKHAWREGQRSGLYRVTNDDVVRAGPEERRANPRSSSAKLRWAVRA
jgi:16S rRNA (cytosine1402-N4)-methyltransferase